MIGSTVTFNGLDYKIQSQVSYKGWFNWDSVFRSPWIKKYLFTTYTDGYYDMEHGGVWVPGGTETVEKEAIILPLSSEDLKYDTGGTYTREDIKIYVKYPDGGFEIYYARRINE